jgi:hypothetical protein
MHKSVAASFGTVTWHLCLQSRCHEAPSLTHMHSILANKESIDATCVAVNRDNAVLGLGVGREGTVILWHV